MDGAKFTSESPGELVLIQGGEHAFIPAPLPASFLFAERLWPLLAEAKANGC
jgi:hypothetical protein